MRRLTGVMVVLTAGFVLVAIGTPLLGMTVFAASDMMMLRAP